MATVKSIHQDPSTKLRPTKDHLVVQRIETGPTTKGGIVLPEQSKEKLSEGIVLALSAQNDLWEYSVGARIVWKQYAGQPVNEGEQERLILHSEDVLAVIRGTHDAA